MIARGVRDTLKELKPPEDVHPGLWLSRYLMYQTWRDESPSHETPRDYHKDQSIRARDTLVQTLSEKPVAAGYHHALNTWKQSFDPHTTACAKACSNGRVVIGVGAKGAAEFGLHLHHTWGVPILPGSSLKGIAAVAAATLDDPAWHRRVPHATPRPTGPNAFDALFGDTEEQGAVIFHDAWYLPNNTRKNGILRDVLTVHQPSYYQKGQEPSDTDSPTPVPFLSVKGCFFVALELHPSLDPAEHLHWLEHAWFLLQRGLEIHGIGAKTNAGYGRIKLQEWSKTEPGKRAVEEQQRRRAEQEARQAQEAHERRAATRRSMSPDERVLDIYKVEGSKDLIQWLSTKGSHPIPGLMVNDREAVVRCLFAHNEARGSDAHPEWRDAVQQLISSLYSKKKVIPSPQAPAAHRTTEFLTCNKDFPTWSNDRHGRKAKKKWVNQHVNKPYDLPSCKKILAHLGAESKEGKSFLKAQAKKHNLSEQDFNTTLAEGSK